MFLSTPPVWVATALVSSVASLSLVSIHATRVGGDLVSAQIQEPTTSFLSTPPVWVATRKAALLAVKYSFLSTPPVWVATVPVVFAAVSRPAVSIHATRVGGDASVSEPEPERERVSIHATRVGGDVVVTFFPLVTRKFLSTPPVWVATLCAGSPSAWG